MKHKRTALKRESRNNKFIKPGSHLWFNTFNVTELSANKVCLHKGTSA